MIAFPENARIYHKSVSLDNDVTPTNREQIETLNNLEDTLYVVNYPSGRLIP